MAQSVEQLIRNQQVAGSNPATSSTTSATLCSRNKKRFDESKPFFVAPVMLADLYTVYVFKTF